jgi:hypothetical protein
LTRAAKLVVLLLLAAACTASSIILLLSLAIAVPVLVEQFNIWQVTGRWSEMPYATIVSTHPNGLLGLMADLLLSWGPAYLILAATGLFGALLWVFEAARSRLIGRSRTFR